MEIFSKGINMSIHSKVEALQANGDTDQPRIIVLFHTFEGKCTRNNKFFLDLYKLSVYDKESVL